MANRIEATLSGAGSLDAVFGAITQDVASVELARIVASWMDAINSAMCPSGLLDRRFLALVSAALNKQFDKTGQLWSSIEDGKLDHNYFVTALDRKLVASLMAD